MLLSLFFARDVQEEESQHRASFFRWRVIAVHRTVNEPPKCPTTSEQELRLKTDSTCEVRARKDGPARGREAAPGRGVERRLAGPGVQGVHVAALAGEGLEREHLVAIL